MQCFFRLSILSALIISCLGLSACTFPPRIYRMDVQQGNLLTEDMVSRVKLGMSKSEIQDILGTPALSHTLNTNRWDYYYFFKSGTGGQEIEKRFTVFFRNDRVASWE